MRRLMIAAILTFCGLSHVWAFNLVLRNVKILKMRVHY
jgi:hypothetical protein